MRRQNSVCFFTNNGSYGLIKGEKVQTTFISQFQVPEQKSSRTLIQREAQRGEGSNGLKMKRFRNIRHSKLNMNAKKRLPVKILVS